MKEELKEVEIQRGFVRAREAEAHLKQEGKL